MMTYNPATAARLQGIQYEIESGMISIVSTPRREVHEHKALGSEPNLFPCSDAGWSDSSSLADRSGPVANEFWLSNQQWAVLEPLIPLNRRGVKPKRNREIISGIVHILKVGCRWRDCPEVYGPHITIYNRFNRWSRDGIWQSIAGRPPRLSAGSDFPNVEARGSLRLRLSGRHPDNPPQQQLAHRLT
jgi:hypothetical protein